MSAIVKRMAAIPCILCLVGGLLLASGCSNLPSVDEAKNANSTAKTNSLSASALLVDGVLTIGLDASDAPYAWKIEDSDTLAGLDVDMGIALADQLGLTARFVDVDTNMAAAAQGVCDVVMGAGVDVAADGSSTIAGTYAETAPAVFGRNSQGTVTYDQLEAARVGVQENSTSSMTLARLDPTVQPISYPSLGEAFVALEAGEVDYVVCDSFMGGYLAVSYNDVTFAGALEQAAERGVAVSSSNVELKDAVVQALSDLSTNGVGAGVLYRYVGSLPSISADNIVAFAAPVDTGEPAPVEGEGDVPAEGEGEPVEGEGEPEPVEGEGEPVEGEPEPVE